MKIGDKYEWFLSLQEKGHKVKILDEQPELYADLYQYWTAFQELSSSRINTGFGVGTIPFSEISSYLNECCITDYEERLTFIKWIKFIDINYVKAVNKKVSVKKLSGQKNGKSDGNTKSKYRR